MLFGWQAQNPEVVEQEIDSTIKRNEIDDSLFKIAFMADLNEEVLKEFRKITVTHEEYYRCSWSVGHGMPYGCL